MLRKTIVTGAAGFIGSHLCRELLNLGVESVIGVDNLRSGNWERVPEDVIRVERNITDISLDEWLEIFHGSEALFHLAAEKYNSSKSTPEKLIDGNVFAAERMFRAAALSGIKRTVFTSSLYAYGSMGPDIMKEVDVPRPNTLYGASKLMGEGILRSIDRDYGLSWNVARLFFIYGPGQFAEGGYKSVIMSNFERIINGDAPIVVGSGNQSLDYVYIKDCINALVSLCVSTQDRKIVNVSTSRPISINDLTESMIKVAHGIERPISNNPDWTEGSSRYGDNSFIKSTFGWEASTSIEDGLAEVHSWMRQASK